MKSNFRIRILLIILLGLSAKLLSQPGMSPGKVYGYVRLTNGDTLKGLIKWKVSYIENNLAEISFTAENGESKDFKAGEISGFGHLNAKNVEVSHMRIGSDNENYESVPSMKKAIPVFIYRFLDGRIKVFQNRKGFLVSHDFEGERIKGVHFRFNPEEGLMIGDSDKSDKATYEILKWGFSSNYLFKKDGGNLQFVDKNNYEILFPQLFGDCREIKEEIERNPDLAGFKYFIILTAIYNDFMNKSN